MAGLGSGAAHHPTCTSTEVPATQLNMITLIEPLQRASFNAGQLMAEHPPKLRDPNKRVVLEVACPPGSIHAGEIEYSRWPACPLPAAVSVSSATERVEVRDGIYDYAPASRVKGAMEWHVNFSDPRLFVAYGSGLFAQDEMQVAEHPALGALREALDARNWPARTEETGQPTPILVKGVQRRCRIAVDPSAAEGRPDGLYGNAFMVANAEVVRRAAVRLEPPTISHLIAIAAPRGRSGRYQITEIERVLVTAFSGFRAAVQESDGAPVVVHTGYWGCGAFGGNRVLMSMLQVLAAESAGVKHLVFHAVTANGSIEFDRAIKKLRLACPEAVLDISLVLERIERMALRWGSSDGN